MNVLHLIETTGPGGAETVFVELAKGLQRLGHRSFPVVHGRGWVQDALQAAGFDATPRPLGRTPDLAFIRAIRRLVRDERITIIQTHLLGSAAYGAFIGRTTGTPVVSTFHGVNDLGRPGLGRTARLGAVRLGVARAVFVSHGLRDAVAPALRLRQERTAVVYNGIDCNYFSPGRDENIRRQVGVQPGEILVGAVGNVRPAKDYATFLRVAALLCGRSPRWRFVIAGDTQEHEGLFNQLVTLRRELSLDDRVTFLGFQEDVPRVLRGLDALLCSSTAEGFSLTICQALASNVPVVSTRCGGPEEILEHSATGLLVDLGSDAALVDALERVQADADLRAGLVRRGREMVVSRFSLDTMLREYQRVYEDVLRTRGKK